MLPTVASEFLVWVVGGVTVPIADRRLRDPTVMARPRKAPAASLMSRLGALLSARVQHTGAEGQRAISQCQSPRR